MKQLLVILLLIPGIGFTQSQIGSLSPDAEKAGMSATQLSYFDTVMQQYINKNWISGGTAMVVRDGQVAYYRSFGQNGDRAYKNDDIYRIASQTKAITSVAVMMLYEEGKLLLDDPIEKYIPEFKNQKVIDKFNKADTTYTTVPAKRPVTIRSLLTHTSGIGYAQIGDPVAVALYRKNGIIGGLTAEKLVLADKMKKLATLPLLNQPGEKWMYGLSVDVLGYLVEVVSGMSLDQFFQQKIFAPLGMKDTYFYIPSAKRTRLVNLYTMGDNNKQEVIQNELNLNGVVAANYPLAQGTYYSGGGGLSSTAYDYVIFLQMLLNGGNYGKVHILSPISVQMMTVDQFDKLDWPANKMGLGFNVVDEKGAAQSPLSVGSFGWGGMFSSTYWVDPKQKIVGQLFLNQFNNAHGEIHEKFQAVVYGAIDKK